MILFIVIALVEISIILLTKQNNLFEIVCVCVCIYIYIYASVYICGSVLAVPSWCLVECADVTSCHEYYRSLQEFVINGTLVVGCEIH